MNSIRWRKLIEIFLIVQLIVFTNSCGQKADKKYSKKKVEKLVSDSSDNSEQLKNFISSIEIEKTKSTIQSGANVNTEFNDGETPLTTALKIKVETEEQKVKKLEMIRLLIASGADVNEKSKKCEYPLILATGLEDLSILHLLFQVEVNLNIQDCSFNTAISMALGMQNIEVLGFILSKHPDLEVENTLGETPLQMAKRLGFAPGISLLETAKTWTEGKLDYQYVQKILSRNDYFSFEFLWEQMVFKTDLKVGPVVRILARSKTCNRRYELIERLINLEAYDRLDTYNRYLPVYAALIEDSELMLLLGRNGISFNTYNNRGESPLYIAVKKANISLVNLLLSFESKRQYYAVVGGKLKNINVCDAFPQNTRVLKSTNPTKYWNLALISQTLGCEFY